MRWELKISIILLIFSVFFYILNYLTFHDTTFIEKYILVQLGFLPISVLLVTIVLNTLIAQREQRERLEKINIVIGSFFAEIGKDLLRYLSKYDEGILDIVMDIARIERSSKEDFQILKEKMEKHSYAINIKKINLYALKKYLAEKKEFVVNLLDNPMLIEHETFTELLWNLLHLTEELKIRLSFEDMNQENYISLEEDIRRVYYLLTYEWLNYVNYLYEAYPRIFLFEARTNPFKPHSTSQQ